MHSAALSRDETRRTLESVYRINPIIEKKPLQSPRPGLFKVRGHKLEVQYDKNYPGCVPSDLWSRFVVAGREKVNTGVNGKHRLDRCKWK